MAQNQTFRFKHFLFSFFTASVSICASYLLPANRFEQKFSRLIPEDCNPPAIKADAIIPVVTNKLHVGCLGYLPHGNLGVSLSQLKTVLLKLQKSFIPHLTQFVRHCTSVYR